MSSSSDSDTEDRVKNVQNLLVKSQSTPASAHVTTERPQEQNAQKLQQQQQAVEQIGDDNVAYKRRLGDLIFNAYFEAGNLGFVEQVDEYEYDLMLRPDVTNPRHRLWFNFSVSNQMPNQCVVFNIVNLSENVTLWHEGLSPVVRCRSAPDWRRLRKEQVFYYRSPAHALRYVLSIAFRFGEHNDEHQFALLYPYTHTQLASFANRWIVELRRLQRRRTNLPQLVVESLGASILNKSIFKLTVSMTTTKAVDPTKPRHKVIVVCRSQANMDAPASLVCQGVIDMMLSCEHEVARSARGKMDLIALPMVEPDAIWAGNARTHLSGRPQVTRELVARRARLYATHSRCSECIASIIANANETNASETSKSPASRVIVLELCVNMSIMGVRLVGAHYERARRMEKHLLFARVLKRHMLDDLNLSQCEFSRTSAASRTFAHLSWLKFAREPNVDQYRLEMSAFGRVALEGNERRCVPYTQRGYLSIGRAIVCALNELLAPESHLGKTPRAPQYNQP